MSAASPRRMGELGAHGSDRGVAAILLSFAERDIGQFVEQAVKYAVKVLARTGGRELTGDLEHRIVLPVEEAPTFEAFRQTQKASRTKSGSPDRTDKTQDTDNVLNPSATRGSCEINAHAI